MDIPALPFCHTTLKAQKPPKKEYPKALDTIGDHIKKRRLELNLYQKDVAKIIGVKEESIYNWENNYSEPQIHLLPKIIEFLKYIPYNLHNNNMTIGDKIIFYRKLHGLSQRRLAEFLEVDETTIRDWEKEKHQPEKKLLKRISEILERIPLN